MAQDNQRGFFGIIIPKEILDDTDLSIAEKFVYGYIASFAKCCFESNEMIASKIGVSESTVRHTIPKLAGKGYLYVEKINNSNNTRRIYSVLDNPKKLAYLAKKGLFKDAQNDQTVVQNMHDENTTVVQNMHDVVQNMHYDLTGVRSAKYALIDKEENKNKVKPDEKTASSAVEKPASLRYAKRSDFDNDLDFEKEFYSRNTIHLGAI